MEDLKPSSREEAVLAKIAGIEDPMVDAFEPSSREEWFMNKIAEKMAEGGGGSGGGVVFVDFTESESGGQPVLAVINKTAGEIMEAIESKNVVFRELYDDTVTYLTLIYATDYPRFQFVVYDYNNEYVLFEASSANDYPISGGKK